MGLDGDHHLELDLHAAEVKMRITTGLDLHDGATLGGRKNGAEGHLKPSQRAQALPGSGDELEETGTNKVGRPAQARHGGRSRRFGKPQRPALDEMQRRRGVRRGHSSTLRWILRPGG